MRQPLPAILLTVTILVAPGKRLHFGWYHALRFVAGLKAA
jgi:hypothetical protein